jgi:hypothetical protein
MTDNLDVKLQDDELLSEIRLATQMMISASRSDRRLTVAEVDEVLGVCSLPAFRPARPVATPA